MPSFQDREDMLKNYMITKAYERESQRLKDGQKQQLQEPADNMLRNALDLYRFHTKKSKAYQQK